jgi:hypothetical protein
MLNPTLSDLIGGIQSVTLSDEEARRRGTQKSILERKGPPTFDIVVEILQRDKVSIHPDVGVAIDTQLRQQPAAIEIRWLDGNGEVRIEKEIPHKEEEPPQQQRKSSLRENASRIFLFGVNKNRLEQSADEMGIRLSIVEKINDANLFITSKQYYRRKPQRVRDAEAANIPIYVLKNNTPGQVRQLIRSIYPGSREEHEHPEPLNSYGSAIHEAEDAVQRLEESGDGSVELSPQGAYIRRLQHLIAERHDFGSKSHGKDPNRHVVIFKQS